MHFLVLRCFFTILLIIGFSFPLHPFGKNKVSYKSFKWKVLSTAHFNIHYDKNLEELAKKTAKYAECLLLRYSKFLKHDLSQTIPIVIYSSHSFFEETNITSHIVGEQTGGFTELLKNRLVLPYEGSLSRFFRVFAHELVHIFQFDILYGRSSNPFGKLMRRRPPIWFMEGMAEYISQGWDSQSEIIIRNSILEGTLPTMVNLNKGWIHPKQYFLIYKLSQAFLYFLTNKYGKDTIANIINFFRTSTNIDYALRYVCKKDFKTLSHDFQIFLKKKYWPKITKYDEKSSLIQRKTSHVKDGSSMNMQPLISPDGKKMAFFSNKDIFPSLYLMDIKTGKVEKRLAVGWRNADFLGLVFSRNSMSWSGDGKYILFISKHGSYNVINVYDYKNDSLVKKIKTPCQQLSDPAFSPDGKSFVFCGSRHGKSGVWEYTFKSRKFRKIIEDNFTYRNPKWLSNKKILFISNRGGNPISSKMRFFEFDFTKGLLKKSAFKIKKSIGQFDIKKNKILFTGIDTLSSDLYIFDLNKKKVNRITHLSGGVYQPRFFPDGNMIAFTYYSKNGYDISVSSLSKLKNSLTKQKTDINKNKELLKNRLSGDLLNIKTFKKFYNNSQILDYQPVLKLDWITGIIAFNSEAGLRLIGQFAMSDIIGDKRLSVTMDLAISSFEDIGKNNSINLISSYNLYQGRIDLSIGIFHFSESMFFYNIESIINSAFIPTLTRRQAGMYLLAKYPVSRFTRLEMIWTSMRIEKFYLDFDDTREANQHTLEFSYVFDNTFWSYFGPMDGSRVKLSIEKGFDLYGTDWSFLRINADFRTYLFFGRRYSLALRFKTGSVIGRDKRYTHYEIGGFNTVRGVDFYSIRGDNMMLANIELRFPFIDFLALGFPFPLRLGGIRGVLFMDMGTAWDHDEKLRLTKNINGKRYFNDLIASIGLGFRILLGPGFRIRWDFSTPFNGRSILPLKKWRGFFSLGVDY